jgi:DNA-binding MarR family transcriptional regulator
MSLYDYIPPEPALEVYDLLQRIHYALDTHSRNTLRVHGLTLPQFTILSLATREGTPLTMISARMLCDNSNLTGIVDRLEADGLVERLVDNQDRRVRLIRLTAAGEEKLRHIGPHHVDSITRRVRSIPEEQVEQLRQILGDLYSQMLAAPLG